MFEKRQSPRRPVDQPIVFTREDGGQPIPAQVLDVSQEGLRMRLDEELDEGSTVYLELDAIRPDFGEDSEVEAIVQNRFQEPAGSWQAGLRLKN